MKGELAAALFASSASLCMAWCGVAIARKRSAAWRCAILRLGLVISVLSTAAAITGKKIDLPFLAPRTAMAQAPVEVVDESERPAAAEDKAGMVSFAPARDLPDRPAPIAHKYRVPWVGLFYAFGVGISLAPLLVGFARVMSLKRGAETAAPECRARAAVNRALRLLKVRCEVRVFLGKHCEVPLAGGIWRPYLLLPETVALRWQMERLTRVACHELAHHRRADIFWNLVGRLICSLLWWQPLAWWALSRMRLESEIACDDVVLNAGSGRENYAEDLLAVARDCSVATVFGAAAMAQPSNVRRRMEAVLALDTDRRQPALWRVTAMLLILAGAGILSNSRLVAAEDPPGKESQEERKSQFQWSKAKVRVANLRGEPVEGASIQLVGMRTDSDPGSAYGVDKDLYGRELVPVVTNKQGEAEVEYPQTVSTDWPTSVVCLSINHPRYIQKDSEITLTKPKLPIVLEDPSSLEVKVPGVREMKGRLAIQMEAPGFYYTKESDWKVAGDTAVNDRMPVGEAWFRAVFLTENGEILFSPVVKKDFRSGVRESVTMEVLPGVTVEGEIAPSVPRPIKGGEVHAYTISEPDGESFSRNERGIIWRTTATIRMDGSFSLPSMPREDVTMLAFCDGFISRQPFRINGGSREGQRFGKNGPFLVGMEQTGTADITVLDPNRKPLPGAEVSFWPNENTGQGNTVLGARLDSAAMFANSDKTRTLASMADLAKRWTARTGNDGKAIVKNLPSGDVSYAIMHPKYRMPFVRFGGGGPKRRQGKIVMEPGSTVEEVVKMEEDGPLTQLPRDKDILISTELVEFEADAETMAAWEWRDALRNGRKQDLAKLLGGKLVTHDLSNVKARSGESAKTASRDDTVMRMVYSVKADGLRDADTAVQEETGTFLEYVPTIYVDGINLEVHVTTRILVESKDQLHERFRMEETRVNLDLSDGGRSGFMLPWEQDLGVSNENSQTGGKHKRLAVFVRVKLVDPPAPGAEPANTGGNSTGP